MKRFFPWIVMILTIVSIASSLRMPKAAPGAFDFKKFGEIPVLSTGRLKPLDTVARNALLIMRGRQTLRLESGETLTATHWLADVMFNAPLANKYPAFAIHNPEVLGLFGWQQGDRKYFSYDEIAPFLEKIDTEGQQAGSVESAQRSAYQTAIYNLRNTLVVYQSLRHDEPMDFAPGEGGIHPAGQAYSVMGDAYRAGKADAFNGAVNGLAASMAAREPEATGRAKFEFLFNHIAPFYQSMTLYVLVFLLVCGSWLGWSQSLNRSAFLVTLAALALHTFGLAARMYLQGRPPVTNLYSSAVFIGWGTVVIGLILERLFRDGIGLACSSVIGFITLIIAHHLAGSGDTLEMLRAVLDTNIWLATHVVSITLGYSAMFLAGMLAMVYVVRGVLTRSLTRESAQSLGSMTYGVLCFATLFSFVGTVLGGIWADQSWGRFWGWDPKENGALLIVLWCAIILHARWGGYIRQRGLMVLALFGNVVTSFSWFGVNMLGVGLHSYGFMDQAFPWLVAFGASQLALMLLAAIPLNRWRSFPIE